ncbi:hypothetical protein ACFVJS_03915 [Nocardioides sp. NPDC057772]|uniref:hypothetical protein n=1 Tax=Nocardioides sp. NPDC057772 TaxID=3346245 RepID=UPI00367069FA
MREVDLEAALNDCAAVVVGPHGERTGHVIGYSTDPMVCVKFSDGTQSWHAASRVSRDPGGLTYAEAERARALANVAGGPSESALLDLVAAVKRDALRSTEEAP